MEAYVTFLIVGLLLISSISKFASRETFNRTLLDIGVGRRWIDLLGLVVPSLEMLFAILLLIPETKIAELAILFMFITFAAIVVKAVYQKKLPECNCFGSLLKEKLGVSTLVRLLILIGLTIFLVFAKSESLIEVPFMQLAYQALTSVGILLIYLLVAKLTQQNSKN